MKKVLTLFIIMAFLLVGCGLFRREEQIPPAPPAETQLERKIGLVSTAEDQQIQNPLTPYMFLAENGEKFFIESVSVNLRRYAKRRVEAEGRFNDQKTVFLVETVTSLGNETQVKTLYQNAAFGLKFQYPSLWDLRESKNIAGPQRIVITPYEAAEEELANVDTFTIEFSENNKRLSPREFLGLDEQYRSADPADTAIYQQSGIGAALLDAVKKTSARPSRSEANQLMRPEGATFTGDRVDFFVSRDTFIYKFSHATQNDSDKDLYRNAFFDLIQSFEFIPFGKEEGGTVPVSAASASLPQTLAERAAPVIAERREAEAQAREEQAARQQADALAASRKLFIDYIESRIFQLIPDPQQWATGMTVLQVEFAAPESEPENFTAIYVVYRYNGLKKILLSVPDRTKPETMARVAAFIEGDSQDWKLIEGTDTAKSSDRTVVKLSNGASSATVVKKGMTLLDARSFDIKIQYPSSWYWAYRNTGYSFSDKPVAGDNALIHLTKDPESLPENMASIGELGGKPAMQGEWAEALSICVQGKAKYCLSGDPSHAEMMKAMLETIEE